MSSFLAMSLVLPNVLYFHILHPRTYVYTIAYCLRCLYLMPLNQRRRAVDLSLTCQAALVDCERHLQLSDERD